MNHRVKKENGHMRFLLLFALLSALVFARYGLQINIPRVLALVVLVAMAFLGDQTEIIAACMCLIPLHEALDFYYALILIVVIYAVKCFERIKVNAGMLLLVFMVVWELLHCFTPDFSPVTFVVSLAPVIALVVIASSDCRDLEYGFVVRAVAYATLVICVTMLVQVAWISRFSLSSFLVNLRRLGILSEASAGRLQISGGIVQTNSLGVICVTVTAALLQLRANGLGRRSDLFSMLALLIFGTFTASRTFLACLAMMILLVLLGQRGLMKKIRYFAMAAFAVGLVVLFFLAFFPDQLAYFVGRFFEADITTGRDDLMIAYHRFITGDMKVLFFGIGLQNYGDKLLNHYRVAPNLPHNSIQEILVAWGVPGLLMVILLVLLLVYRARRCSDRWKLVNYIPLILILFKSMAGQLLTSNYSMLALAFGYLNLIQNGAGRKEE